MSFIEVKNLNKEFSSNGETVKALSDINFSIEKADIYGIIGMSGAGKSTLVRCLNFLERPTSGQVLIDGKNLGELSEKELLEERRGIAMIFQHFNLLMQKNVLSNVCFPLKLKRVGKKQAEENAYELLETVGLKDKAKAYPSCLSGGQKQRVAIARALASNPKILLCDEATSALDPQTTESILSLLKEINKKYGITIVIITHQMSVIQEICNKVAIIPFLILLILMIPITRLIAGKSYGATATIIPLVVTAAPYIARLVESSLKEVDKGVIEAARSMGATNRQIVCHVLLVEARTSIVMGATIATGTILGYSAMAGTVGGGGLGDIAVRYGYYRWQTDIMLITVLLIVVIFQVLQNLGMITAKKINRK